MQNYVMLIGAVVLLAMDFVCQKLYQRYNGCSLESGLKFNIILGFLKTIIFYFINGLKIEITVFSLIMAMVSAILTVSYTIIAFKLFSLGEMAYYTFFLMTGGMTVPYVWGLIFLDEPLSLLRTIGLFIIVFSIFIINAKGAKFNKKQIFLFGAIFVLNGFVSVTSKMHQISSLPIVSSEGFVLLSGVMKAAVCLPVYLTMRMKNINSERNNNNNCKNSTYKIISIVSASALIGGLSYLLQLKGAETLPATVLYPIITGGGIIFSALAGWICFKEKPTKQLVFGILICFIGTCMFL